MEVSSEVSSKALLDLWGINDDDIKRYRICRKLTDPSSCSLYTQIDATESYLCSISSPEHAREHVPDRKMAVLNNLKLVGGDGAQHKFEAPTTGIDEENDEETNFCKRYLPIQPTNDLSNEYSQLNGQDRSETTQICDWCHCVNELKLSWCENCGRVINNDQQYSSCKDPLNSGNTQESSYYGNTQTNLTSLGSLGHTKTRKCTQLKVRCDSYQRHWKKSSYYLWMKPSSSIVLVDDEVAGLKHERVKAGRRMNAENNVICALPDEVLLRILSYLPRSSLLVCLLTCRRLNMIATDSSLWRNIELWKISDSILRCVAKRKPTRLTLKYCSAKLTASCVKECFTAIGQKLQYLKIDCCVFDDDYQLLTTVGVVCPHLQVLYLDHVIMNVSILQHIVNNCTQLKDLTLIGTGMTMLSISHLLHCYGDRLSSVGIKIIQ